MSARGRDDGRRTAPQSGVIVLAGEDQNDCEIMAALIRAHRPDLCTTSKLVRINDPVRLRRKSGDDLATAVKVLTGKARAKARQQKARLTGFVVHEDLDAFTGSDYGRVRKVITDELGRQEDGFRTALALAAWESEGWLLLFPEAFPRVRPRWRVPVQLRGRDSGRIKKPKQELKNRLGTPLFRESDGPLVARKALEHGLIPAPEGTNGSYADFVGDLKKWS
ncbi:hypothetical protein ACGFYT_20525 [Streptomyces sp. NPDC048208]|uniref:hypothetical protein n=1 Tax=Streptomyces sp. NPDC048208 TaxID=3365515 RepID=UPI00371FBC1D